MNTLESLGLKLESLEAKRNSLSQELKIVEVEIEAFIGDPINNVFESLEKAKRALYNRLSDYAENACEGRYNYGCDEYIQEFSVDGKKYLATATVEYNRHDKTYYYVDGFQFNIKEL